MADKKPVRGYLNPSRLGQLDPIDLLTPDGEHEQLPLAKIRSIYFVRDFAEDNPDRWHRTRSRAGHESTVQK